MLDNRLELIKAKKLIESLDYSKLSSITKNNCSQISLTTAVKDRTDYLDIALSSWVKFPFKEIVIVDWTSKNPFIPKIKDKRIKLIHVHGQKFYEHSKVRNFKVNNTNSDFVYCTDCDVVLTPKFLSSVFIRRNFLYMIENSASSSVGSSVFDKTVFNNLGGFNEMLDNGWGYEDLAFYRKAEELGYDIVMYPVNHVYHIEHDDNLRVINTKNTDKWVSNAYNMKIAADNPNYINPIFKGSFTVYCNDREEFYNVE